MNDLYISILRKEVEKQASLEPVTTDDFARLSEMVVASVGERLSVSTLKRTWSRVRDEYTRRPATLSILAQFIGYRNWQDFFTHTRDKLREESDFKPMDALDFDTLPENAMLKVFWMPDRYVRLLHGKGRFFTVLESENSKLRVNDILEMSMLAPGEPMFVKQIKRGDKEYSGYVAGQIHGVSFEIL